jgi:hypothetical protein
MTDHTATRKKTTVELPILAWISESCDSWRVETDGQVHAIPFNHDKWGAYREAWTRALGVAGLPAQVQLISAAHL